jgi:hypothetical protein
MPRQRFEPALSRGHARKLHARAFGDLDARYPWAALDPARYPEELRARARFGWTENAFNEFCTAAAMGQLVQALGQAGAPLDLWRMAMRFAEEELLHVELCARVAHRLGGGVPIEYDPEALAVPVDASRPPLERATELVVRLCCVGEALSFPLLTGCLRSAANPLTRAVLATIVADEAMHGRFGWLYLDWVAPTLDAAQRRRLGRAAAETLAGYVPLWERLRSRVVDGVTSEGFQLEHVRELGWMESQEYAALARASAADAVRAPLLRHGIELA